MLAATVYLADHMAILHMSPRVTREETPRCGVGITVYEVARLLSSREGGLLHHSPGC